MFNNLLRFYVVAGSSPIFILRMLSTYKKIMKNFSSYSEETRYREAQKIMRHMKERGRTKTAIYGYNNIPKDGGYIMYPNHQGKYDALGLMLAHNDPCAVLMEMKQSQKIVAKQVVDYVEGKRLDFDDPRQQLKVLTELAEEVKRGRRYIIFPEGGYKDNKNKLQKFNSGCFRCALGSKCPIIPVVLYDSYKSLNTNNFKKVVTQIHFLKPLYYEEYGSMKKTELSEHVKALIQERIDLIEAGKFTDKADKII